MDNITRKKGKIDSDKNILRRKSDLCLVLKPFAQFYLCVCVWESGFGDYRKEKSLYNSRSKSVNTNYV